ncbi:MAG: carbamoyltransferase HypF [Verrucomicrobiota bacterium]|nr:carbamoyltransferase HypF [Verrucomicrobiota bacterium]
MPTSSQRRSITVSGIVQGVGFRPFVFALAQRLRLSGHARNQSGHVVIEVEGGEKTLDEFAAALASEAPALARIDEIKSRQLPLEGTREFRIETSDAGRATDVFISPDVATCADCLRELFDPADRRHRYPFINCTNCGPRLTIITGAPYDRARTTMAAFAMCADCRREYTDPADRRFHAQPIACPRCGPELRLIEGEKPPRIGDDALLAFAASILDGRIGALKGLGGFHLVCDATNDAAIARLRARKHREEKPFAIMVGDVAAAANLCELSETEAQLLSSRAAPIVLLKKKSPVADALAPGNPHLGVMLAYTPLHHLLLRAVEGRPLVMTSGNRSDEPIAQNNDDALEQLREIADLFLVHDRAIHLRCDDSVTRVLAGVELPLRRSRGYAPQPIALPFTTPEPILAVGAQLKGTFAFGRGRHAFLSHHLGDLDHRSAWLAFERDLALYRELFEFEPACLAHDLHPDYASTRYAQASGLPLIAVQHHHAHMASCMAENGLTSPVIGVSFDGLGLGTDGAIWGGEFLVGDYAGFRRAAHLRYVGMPGGDQATREPWRMAVAHLADAEVTCAEFTQRIAATDLRVVNQMLERRLNTPLTSSAGRLFDAVAALAGVRDRVSYEGQAAMELEWLATGVDDARVYPFALDDALNIDTRPLVAAIVAEVDRRVEKQFIARRFHSTVVEIIAAVCTRLRSATQLNSVTLSGGVFMNALLTAETMTRLEHDGFAVYRHHLVPPNDAGLSLGQIAIASAARTPSRIDASRVIGERSIHPHG